MNKSIQKGWALALLLLPFSHNVVAEDERNTTGKVQQLAGEGIIQTAIYATGTKGLLNYWIIDLGREWKKTVYAKDISAKDFLIIKNGQSVKRTFVVTTEVNGSNQLLVSEDDEEVYADITPTFVKSTDSATICQIDSYVDGFGFGHGDPNKVFLSCSGDSAGLYYSPDQCASWVKVFDGAIDFFIADYKGPLLAVGYTDDEHTTHICMSNDDGATWREVYTKADVRVMGATIHPASSADLMCVYGDEILVITNDGGATWKEMALPAGTVDVGFQYNNDYELYAAVNGEEGMSLWHSKNLGDSWQCGYTLPSDSSDLIIDMDVYFFYICWLTRSGCVYRLFQGKDSFELLNDYEAMFSNIRSRQSDEPFTPYYDLQGRPVANPARGIYIKDGKKIAVD